MVDSVRSAQPKCENEVDEAKKSVARRHHYLPQSYLSGFTDSGTKDGRFYVVDVGSGHRFRTSPINVAVSKDFNRVDIEGLPSDTLENAFSPMEGMAANAIATTVRSGAFPNDEDYSSILNLICLVAVRNPAMRNAFNAAREHTIKIIGQALVSRKEVFEHNMKSAKDAGYDISDNVTFDEMKEFIEGEEYDIEFHPQGNLRIEMNAFNTMLPLLGDRTWSLILAPDAGPEFICSDHPVALEHKNGPRARIGLGTRHSELFFPLSRRAGFLGTFEEPLPLVVHARPGNVATMNKRVAYNAFRHVFSALEAFSMWHEGSPRDIDCT